MKSIFVENNSYGKKIHAEIKEFNDILHHQRLILNKNHTVGKIDISFNLQHFHEVKPYFYKEYKEEKIHNLYCFGNTLVTWINLKGVAEDAKINGLLKNAKVDTLLDNAKFLVNVTPDKPLIIQLGAVTYFIAPVIGD